MDCRHVQDYIVPYIEAELSPTMHTWINEHLKECDTCATLGQHLQNLEMPQLPEPSIEQMLSMHHALEQTLQEKSRYLSKPARHRNRFPSVLRDTAPIALLVLSILGLSAWDIMEDFSADNYPSSTSAGIVTPDKHWF